MDAIKLFFGAVAVIFALWFLLGSGSGERNFLKNTFDSDGNSRSDNNSGFSREEKKLLSYGYALSPYRGQVEISRSRAREESAREEYVTIEADRHNTISVPITGWRLESAISKRGRTIQQATQVLEYLEESREANVFLAPGEEAHIISGKPLLKTSFKENICTGYLEENRDFVPRLDRSCPSPFDEDLEDFGIDEDREEECVDFLRSVPRCTNPQNPTDEDDVSNDCEEFVREYLTYEGCVALHRRDDNFLGDEWYLYLGIIFDGLWDDESDTLLLLDAQKRIVDVLEY